jgi:hypothetical protein
MGHRAPLRLHPAGLSWNEEDQVQPDVRTGAAG